MNDELSKLLERLRRSAGLSRAEGAVRSGVSRMTLFRWERGDNLPHEYELRAVLDAYAVSPAQSRQVHAVRERAGLNRVSRSGRRLPMPQAHLGDLLMALRERAGLTQAEVAARVAVPRASVIRWENLRSWPDDATLHRLAYTLNATETELLALTAPPTPQTTEDRRSLQSLYFDADMITWGWPPLGQSEPEILRLMARLRPLAPDHREANRLLVTLEYGYSMLLMGALRHRESARWLKCADADFPGEPTANELVWPVSARTLIQNEGLRRANPNHRHRALRENWEGQRAIYDTIDRLTPPWQIAHLLEMASSLQRLGEDDSALRLASFAFSMTEHTKGSQPELRLSRYGATLHASGKHDLIADLFPAYLGRSAYADAHIRYYLGLAARAHGDESAADALLHQALADAATHNRPLLERDIRQSLPDPPQ